MNKEEIVKGLIILKSAYPNSFKNFTKDEIDTMATVWLDTFYNDEPQYFVKAIKRLIRQEKFCPSLSDIKRETVIMSIPCLQLDSSNEWYKVTQVAKKYGPDKEMEALKELTPFVSDIVSKHICYQNLCKENTSLNCYESMRDDFKSAFEYYQKQLLDALIIGEKQLTISELENFREQTPQIMLKETKSLE